MKKKSFGKYCLANLKIAPEAFSYIIRHNDFGFVVLSECGGGHRFSIHYLLQD